MFIRVTLEKKWIDCKPIHALVVPEHDTHTRSTPSQFPDTPSIVGRHSNPAWPSARLLLVLIYDLYWNVDEDADLI